MRELPVGWVEATLGDLGAWTSGGTPSRKNPNYYKGSIPWVKTGDLRDGPIVGELERISKEAVTNSSAKMLPASTVLMAMYGATIGRLGVLNYEATCNQACAALLPQNENFESLPFVFHYLRSARERFKSEGKGGAQPNISQGLIKDFDIPLPPLNEQKRIVAKIDVLTEKSREARQALEEVPVLLDQLRQSILAAAFRGDLTKKWREQNPNVEPASVLLERIPAPGGKSTGREASVNVIRGRAALSVNDPQEPVPDRWQRVLLLRIARLESGHTPSRQRPEWWDGDVPWISIGDARDHHGLAIHATAQNTNSDGLANSAARLLPANTVCLSRTASVGYVTKMGVPMATSQDFVNWVCSPALSPDFLLYALLAEGEHLLKFGKGSTHTTIYFPEVKAFHIALPPRAEQDKIVELVRDRLAMVANLERVVKDEQVTLGTLDPSILAKAFRGELVPHDPSDEPASVLLERIRKERAGRDPSTRAQKAKNEKPGRLPARRSK